MRYNMENASRALMIAAGALIRNTCTIIYGILF